MRWKNKHGFSPLPAVLLVLVGLPALHAGGQGMSSFERGRARQILGSVSDQVSKHYYDPEFHGLDWEAKVRATQEEVEQATSFDVSLSHIAALLESLNDSHTYFVPPPKNYRLDEGWQYQMIGERCYVTQVRPGSDAETQGVKPGDEIQSLNGYHLNQNNIWKIKNVYGLWRPQPDLHSSLIDQAGAERFVDFKAKTVHTMVITEDGPLEDATGIDNAEATRRREIHEHLTRLRYAEMGPKLMILKVPEFSFVRLHAGAFLPDAGRLNEMIAKARKHEALILDLRGNPGGDAESLKLLVSRVFDTDIKIADRAGRTDFKPYIAKSMGQGAFGGKLVVLIDRESASLAEIFARLVQIEKRGVVMGDRSSGRVMEASVHFVSMGSENYTARLATRAMSAIPFGASITEADVIMSDGKSLEHVGVAPDKLIIPTAADLANGRDPVLAYAAETLGAKLTPEEAAKLFPYEWPPT